MVIVLAVSAISSPWKGESRIDFFVGSAGPSPFFLPSFTPTRLESLSNANFMFVVAPNSFSSTETSSSFTPGGRPPSASLRGSSFTLELFFSLFLKSAFAAAISAAVSGLLSPPISFWTLAMMMIIGSMSTPSLKFAVPERSLFSSIDCSTSKQPVAKKATSAAMKIPRVRTIWTLLFGKYRAGGLARVGEPAPRILPDMRKFILAVVLTFVSLSVFAQTPPDTLWRELMEGNKLFVQGQVVYGNLPSMRALWAGGQNPPVSIVSCADSRVPAEIVFARTVG